MAPTIIKCGYTDCDYKSEHESETVASLQFQSHMTVHTSKVQAPASGDSVRAKPEVEKPILKQDVTEEEWDTFTQAFRRYKRRIRTPVGQEADDLFNRFGWLGGKQGDCKEGMGSAESGRCGCIINI